MSSSGVPMPTNPEVHTVSPSRITATASSGETILCVSMLRGRVLVVLGQPVRDARAQQPLRLAAHEHAHMAAGQRELLIILAPDAEPQGLGGCGRNDMVVLSEHVQDRHREVLQVDHLATELQLAFYELVVLVEVLEPLLGGLAGMVRAVRNPLLHAQKVQKLLLVVHDLEQVEVVLGQRAHGRHHREHRAHELARQVAVGLDQAVDVLRLETTGPDIDEPEAQALLVGVAVEVNRRDGEDEVLHRLGVEGGVARREHPALADTKQADLVDAVALTDELDASVQVAIDVVVERQPAIGAGWVAPIDDVKVDPEVEQVANERAVLLQVGHRVASDQPIGDQNGRFDLLLCHGPVTVEGDLVLPPDLFLWRRGDLDVLVADLLEQLGPFGDLLPERLGFGDALLRLDPNGLADVTHEDAPIWAGLAPPRRGCAAAARRGALRAAPFALSAAGRGARLSRLNARSSRRSSVTVRCTSSSSVRVRYPNISL